jgi:hypothetical protein
LQDESGRKKPSDVAVLNPNGLLASIEIQQKLIRLSADDVAFGVF